jgi:uncharacterized membrane protein
MFGWILLALVLIFLFRFAFGWGWCGPWHHHAHPYVDAREELRQRLARGDITPEEYEKRKALLSGET